MFILTLINFIKVFVQPHYYSDYVNDYLLQLFYHNIKGTIEAEYFEIQMFSLTVLKNGGDKHSHDATNV